MSMYLVVTSHGNLNVDEHYGWCGTNDLVLFKRGFEKQDRADNFVDRVLKTEKLSEDQGGGIQTISILEIVDDAAPKVVRSETLPLDREENIEA